MRLKSIAIGEPKKYFRGEKEFQSAYKKDIFLESVKVTKLGIEGDFQIDKRFHGGEDKAIHMGAISHLEKNPNFDRLFIGCNILVDGLDESSIYVGDIYKIGEVRVEVTQPRHPCWKIGVLFGKEVNRYIKDNSATGWYLKVLDEGEISLSDEMILEKRVSSYTIKELAQFLKNPPKSKDTIDSILEIPSLANSYKKDLKRVTNP